MPQVTTDVGGHKRRTSHGEVPVRPHKRKTRGGRGGGRKKSLPRRGISNLKSAYKYAKRKKRVAAVAVGLWGVGQIATFVTLRGVSVVAASIALLAGLVAAAGFAATSTGGSGRK